MNTTNYIYICCNSVKAKVSVGIWQPTLDKSVPNYLTSRRKKKKKNSLSSALLVWNVPGHTHWSHRSRLVAHLCPLCFQQNTCTWRTRWRCESEVYSLSVRRQKEDEVQIHQQKGEKYQKEVQSAAMFVLFELTQTGFTADTPASDEPSQV